MQTRLSCYNLWKDQTDTNFSVVDPPSGDPSISSSSQTFVYTSGESVNLTCTVFGGNPIANLSWECSYTDPKTETRSNSSFAASILFLNVDKEFNNKDCTCTASHPLQVKKETVMLTVYCEYYNSGNDDELSVIHVLDLFISFQMKAI